MQNDPLALLLAGQYPDPDTGALLACECRAVAIEDTLVDREVELVAALDLGERLAILSDTDTFAALGARVERALASRFAVQRVMLPRAPEADTATIAAIASGLDARTDAVVAVGSGTLNDLAKMVALARGVPQIVFGTAPSMNGYASVSASITDGGFKRSIRARTPTAIFLDLGVLAAAPARLIRAGLGDSVCRPTAQADWLLAHLLLDKPYRGAPFALLAADEPVLFGEARALPSGDPTAMRALARTLVLSGMGMTLAGGSYPASQGEHLVGHYLDMMRPHAFPPSLHGEQIGVASIAVARIQQALLASDSPPRVAPTRTSHAELVAHFGASLGEACWREFSAKRLDADGADRLNARIAAEWPDIRARIAAVAAEPAHIAATLAAAGAPTTAADLGISDDLLATALAHAREIRDRYTFLDLAADLDVRLARPQ
ncbi:MAG TPA: iron-containing alcohol dehydrogenase [Kofleriaceae bacterium]|jgi:glycerol-1-phosphate dehydrogenase [NAD(P)+]